MNGQEWEKPNTDCYKIGPTLEVLLTGGACLLNDVGVHKCFKGPSICYVRKK